MPEGAHGLNTDVKTVDCIPNGEIVDVWHSAGGLISSAKARFRNVLERGLQETAAKVMWFTGDCG